MLFAVDVDVVVTWSLEAPGFNSHIGQSKINNINYYSAYDLQYKNWKIKLPTNPGQTGMGFSWVKKPTHTHIQDYPTHQPMAIPTFTSWSPLASPIFHLSLLLPTFSDAIDRILKWKGANQKFEGNTLNTFQNQADPNTKPFWYQKTLQRFTSTPTFISPCYSPLSVILMQ